jgi:phosphatidate cytidylyltransferase
MAGASRVRDAELRRRSLVGTALAAGAVAALWLGGAVFWAVVTVVALIALFEWGGLVRAHRARIGIAMIVLIVGMGYALPFQWGTERATLALLLISAMVLAIFPRFAGISLGLGYVGTAAIALLYLREQPNGLNLALWVLVVVCATDIGGYVAGRSIGGPKLAPAISPSKTWAGLAGGLAAAAILGALVASAGQLPTAALWLGAPLAVVAQLGDLFESGLKRRAGLKDSGRILPGHGGVLDRIDGLLPVAIIVAALVANGSF